jgi:hypothetical protein
MSKAALIAMLNVRKPFNKVDNSYFGQLQRDANEILKQALQRDYQGPYKELELRTVWSRTLDQVNPSNTPTANSASLRSSLKNIHNCLGRMQLGELPYDTLPSISSSWRVTRDLTRILLASRIYRAAHRGKLPDSTLGFVPILGGWPIDAYNGKPFIYLPKQEKVYGVGQDLVDHGGDVHNNNPYGKDAGISLKMAN